MFGSGSSYHNLHWKLHISKIYNQAQEWVMKTNAHGKDHEHSDHALAMQVQTSFTK